MALQFSTQVLVQVRFKVVDDTIPGDPGFSDALYMTMAEFQAATNPQLRAQGIARYNDWRNYVPPIQPPRTPKQRREDAITEMRISMDALQAKAAEILDSDAE